MTVALNGEVNVADGYGNSRVVQFTKKGKFLRAWACVRFILPPVEWYTTKNVVWKTPMPGPSYSIPVLVGDRIFICSRPCMLHCLDKKTARVLWEKYNSIEEPLSFQSRASVKPTLSPHTTQGLGHSRTAWLLRIITATLLTTVRHRLIRSRAARQDEFFHPLSCKFSGLP